MTVDSFDCQRLVISTAETTVRSVITTRFFEVVAVRWVFRCVAGMLQRCEGCGLYYDVSDPQEYAKHKNH